MEHEVPSFFERKPWHVLTHGHSLVEWFHHGKLHGPPQFRLSREDKDERIIGVHLEVGQQSQFFEGRRFMLTSIEIADFALWVGLVCFQIQSWRTEL